MGQVLPSPPLAKAETYNNVVPIGECAMKPSDDVVERWKRDRDIYFRERAKMRAPFHYSETAWDNIKENLDRIGINADTATVAFGQTPRSLRAELEEQVQEYYESLSAPNPSAQEYSDAITSDIGKVAEARDLFSANNTSVLLHLLDDKRAAELHELLGAAVTELQERAKLIDYRNSDFRNARHNARKLELHCYLLSLVEVWDELVDGKSAPPRRLRNDFVWVCAAPVVKTKLTKRGAKIKLTKRGVRIFLSSGFALGQ